MDAPKKSVRPTARKYVDKDGKKKTVTVTTKEAMEIKKITDAYTDQSEAEYYVNKYLNELTLQAEEAVIQKNIDDNSKTGLNKGGMTMRKGNMAYNKGGMGKSKTGHSDYRKGGMVYTTKGKK
tara:strand:+ start:44 stop:412 length:369 start_codon:yes stop_codon:yes gene_type:complete